MLPRRRFPIALSALCLAATVSHAGYTLADEPPPDDSPPDVSITTPQDGATFPDGTAALTVEVDAKDEQTGVTTVWLFVDDEEVATLRKAPYKFESVPMSAGPHTLVAKASNWDGKKGQSDPVKITWAAKAEAKSDAESDAKAESKPKSDAKPDAKDGCFASARPRSLAGSGIALMFAVFAGLMLRRRR